MKGAFFSDAVFSDDGNSLYALTEECDTIQVFDTRTVKLRDKITLPPTGMRETRTYFQVVPGRGIEAWQMVVKNGTTVLSRINLQTRRTQVVSLRNCQSVDLMPSDRGQLLLNTTDRLQMFDASTGALLWHHPRTNDLGVKISPDETMYVVAFSDQFKIYDARTGRFLRWLPAAIVNEESGLQDFAFSSDSNRLMTAYRPEYTAPPTLYFSQRAR